MQHWAINTARLDKRGTLSVPVRHNRPSIAVGDLVVHFKRDGDEVTFTSTSKVVTATPPSAASGGSFVFEMAPPAAFTDNRLLSDFKWSLLKVYRYRHPTRHFQLSYTHVPDTDFETIRLERLFVARTAFGLFFNALPLEVQRRYRVIAWERGSLTSSPTYAFLWNTLAEFVVGSYGHLGLALGGIQSELTDMERRDVGLYRQLTASGGPFLLDPDSPGAVPDPLPMQAEKFHRLDLALHPLRDDVLDSVAKSITETRATESMFEQAFKGREWPAEYRE
jgi:hypothetical protein